MRTIPVDLLNAFGLLTRLPVPATDAVDPGTLSRSVWAYPVVGAVVGAIAALVWFAGQLAGLGGGLSAGLALASQVLVTGALHEDGLADFADGLGGGREPDRVLAIMRDSRIGTYGVLALGLVLGLRWGGIADLPLHQVLAGLICAGLLGRLAIVLLLAMLKPARVDGLGVTVASPPKSAIAGAVLLSAGIVFLHLSIVAAGLAFVVAIAAAGGVALLAKRRIGGYTGDVLGAGEQITETAVLITLAATI
ncbi:MAG: adenosylcobinamide-GDP ribazoletransferase [Hyphomicrobiaceae bacterium]|nr:adenosylcobinamide-GDP ribazoletransferase [Hyphomicrobiaceae bacterium]